MIKTRTWIIVFSALLLLSAAVSVIIFTGHTGSVANIYRDGECIYSIDLSLAQEGYELVFSDESGTNTVRVEPGRICIISADCPDKVCVNSGWISDSAAPIVCLPHRLVIRIEKTSANDTAPDSVTR